MARSPFGFGDDGPTFPQYPLDYNAFHIQRIKDVIEGKDTPCLGNYSRKRADRIRHVRQSLCEIQWSGKPESFDIEVFDAIELYFDAQVKTMADAKIWVKIAEQYLTENNAILHKGSTQDKEGLK
jgi:hypothetical protein